MIIKLVVKVHTLGVMVEYTKDNGLIIICMVKVLILGKMVENMKESIIMIKNM